MTIPTRLIAQVDECQERLAKLKRELEAAKPEPPHRIRSAWKNEQGVNLSCCCDWRYGCQHSWANAIEAYVQHRLEAVKPDPRCD